MLITTHVDRQARMIIPTYIHRHTFIYTILMSVKANREMQLEPRQNNVSLEAVAFSALLRCATVSEPMLLSV